jgi:hypothetical protein
MGTPKYDFSKSHLLTGGLFVYAKFMGDSAERLGQQNKFKQRKLHTACLCPQEANAKPVHKIH